MSKINLENGVEIYNFGEPYIIAEIGANHNGDMDMGMKLVGKAKECGANAVKFQSWTPSSLISEQEYRNNQVYNDSPKKHFGSLREMVERYYLKDKQHYELNEYCRDIGMDFCSTPFSISEVDLLYDLNVPFFKVASMDITNWNLLKYISEKGKPIILSTGMSTLGEIEGALNIIKKSGDPAVALLHCISIYPPNDEDVNLRNITMLQQTFNLPVGFSDHSLGISIPVSSVVLGACIIEKHFTLDKTLPGWDHEISADPEELEEICKSSMVVYSALGSYERKISNEEKLKRSKFRRSIVLSSDLKKGAVIGESDLAFKRPGTGIAPNLIEHVLGRSLKEDMMKDDLLDWKHLC